MNGTSSPLLGAEEAERSLALLTDPVSRQSFHFLNGVLRVFLRVSAAPRQEESRKLQEATIRIVA